MDAKLVRLFEICAIYREVHAPEGSHDLVVLEGRIRGIDIL